MYVLAGFYKQNKKNKRKNAAFGPRTIFIIVLFTARNFRFQIEFFWIDL